MAKLLPAARPLMVNWQGEVLSGRGLGMLTAGEGVYATPLAVMVYVNDSCPGDVSPANGMGHT